MKIPTRILDIIAANCAAAYPNEGCGVLMGRPGNPDHVTDAMPVDNAEVDSPRTRYRIDPRDLVLVQRLANILGYRILGYYHSHPDHDPIPSEEDRAMAAAGASDGVYHLIVRIDNGILWGFANWIFLQKPSPGRFSPDHVELLRL